jgi:acetyl esterase/lipase
MGITHHARAADGSALALEVFSPTARSRETAILLVHGGGWRAGSPQSTHVYANYLSSQGFTAITVQYRLLPSAPWPAQLDDIVSALEWVDAHANDLNVRRERIALQGFSAGAHLSLLAGARAKNLVAAIIAFFAPSRLSLTPQDSAEADAAKLLGFNPDPREATLASPIDQFSGDFPPTFFLHGSADWMVGANASIRMFEALTNAGVATELHVVAGGHHEFSSQPSMLEPIQSEVISFLDRVVVDPVRHAEETQSTNPFAKGPEYIAQLAAQRAQARS